MTKALHFNTFGGNPMATTVASAVMDVSGAVCVLCVCCVCACVDWPALSSSPVSLTVR